MISEAEELEHWDLGFQKDAGSIPVRPTSAMTAALPTKEPDRPPTRHPGEARNRETDADWFTLRTGEDAPFGEPTDRPGVEARTSSPLYGLACSSEAIERWHRRFVQSTNAGLEFMLMLWDDNPELRKDVLAELDHKHPGLCESLADALSGRPRPQGVEYWGDDD